MRAAQLVFALSIVLFVPASVGAQSVSIGNISGPGGGVVERELRSELSDAGFDVSDGGEITIGGRVRRRGRRYVLRLTVSGGSGDGERIRVAARQPPALISSAVEALRPHLGSGGGGGGGNDDDGDDGSQDVPDDPYESSGSADSGGGGGSSRPRRSSGGGGGGGGPSGEWVGEDALEIAAGVGWMARSFSFEDDIFDRIGQYELLSAPTFSASLRWFPGHHWTSDALAGFGVEGALHAGFGVDSTTQDGMTTFATTIDAWRLGLVYRVRVAEPLRIEGMLNYGEQRFRVDPAGPTGPSSGVDAVPSVRYGYLRPAVGVHVDIAEGFSVRGSAGWRAIVSTGELSTQDWFPRSSTQGVDMNLEIWWRFDRWFAARVYINHTRYITDIQPEVGDVRVAGGAADEFTRAGAELIMIVPGVR